MESQGAHLILPATSCDSSCRVLSARSLIRDCVDTICLSCTRVSKPHGTNSVTLARLLSSGESLYESRNQLSSPVHTFLRIATSGLLLTLPCTRVFLGITWMDVLLRMDVLLWMKCCNFSLMMVDRNALLFKSQFDISHSLNFKILLTDSTKYPFINKRISFDVLL